MQLALLSLIIIANLHRCSLSWKQQHIFLLLVWSCPETLDLKELSQYGGRFKKCRRLQNSDPTWNSNFLLAYVGSISFAFGAKKDDWGTGFSVLATWELEREPKIERGERGRKKTISYLSSPTPPHSFTHAIFLIPCSSLRNRREMLAMQANFFQVTLVKLWFYKTKQFADFRKVWWFWLLHSVFDVFRAVSSFFFFFILLFSDPPYTPLLKLS